MKNKFIISVVAIIIVIIGYVFFSSSNDQLSSVVLVSWDGYLNDQELKIQKKEALWIWDTVETRWTWSLAIIEWWDGSITRLWDNTTIIINELFVSDNLDTIQLAFSLEAWKTWSNVVSFLWEDSYFKESFRDNEAAVRWTVFNVDLDNEYIYVTDHQVALTSAEGKSFVIDKNQPFSLSSFSFIDLAKFIRSIKDKAWEDLNKQIDIEFINWLKAQVLENLDNIHFDVNNLSKLSPEQKEELYDRVIEQYQKLHFAWVDDTELFKKKNELRDILLETATSNNKKILLQQSLLDLRSSIDKKIEDSFSIIIDQLNLHTSSIEDLNINIDTYVSFDSISTSFNNSFKDQLDSLKSISDKLEWLDVVEGITNQLKDDISTIEEDTKWALNTIKNLFSN